MTITLAFHWWYLPILLAVIGLWLIATDRPTGSIIPIPSGAALFGVALLVAAAASALTGWLA